MRFRQETERGRRNWDNGFWLGSTVAAFSQGIVLGDSVACPLHNWTIGLADGCAKAPDVGCTTPFSCKVDGGEVFRS